MTEEKLKKILIGLGVGTIAIAGLLIYLQQEKFIIKQNFQGVEISLEDSLIKYNISTTSAKNIDDYFATGKIKLTPGVNGEQQQWIDAFNQATKELKVKTFGPFKSKEEMVSKMNDIIKQGATKK